MRVSASDSRGLQRFLSGPAPSPSRHLQRTTAMKVQTVRTMARATVKVTNKRCPTFGEEDSSNSFRRGLLCHRMKAEGSDL